MSVRVLATVLVAMVAAGCSGGPPAAQPAPTAPVTTTTTIPPTTVPAPATTAAPTTTSTTVRPTTTLTTLLAMGPGEASIVGTVLGPSGPVDGAIVRVERLVGRSVVSQDVSTSGGGSWGLPLILGGSYRVRAFRPPDFGSSPTQTFFLAANERKVVDLRMPAATGERILATVSPNPPRVDQAATITIQVGAGRVDDQGRPALTPLPGVPLSLAPGPGIVLETAPQAVTDGNGSAVWRFRCQVEGANTFPLTVGTGVTQVVIPPCSGAPPPPPAATTTTRR